MYGFHYITMKKLRTLCKYVWFSLFYNEKNIENLVNMYGFHSSTMNKLRKPCKYVWFSLFYQQFRKPCKYAWFSLFRIGK